MDAQLTAVDNRSILIRATIVFFAAALFTSAYLLFWLQPLIGKMLLPLLGGAPSVWNTCMVFFQALLLAGYAYALFISQRFRLRNQALFHITLVLAAAFFLPFAISDRMLSSVPTQGNPTFWLLGVLFITVGFPFFILSATAPLLQRWFSHSSHRSAKDPYFLYAVSNAGSMLSLLAFPFLLEPGLDLKRQSLYWALGYVLLAVLIGCCAAILKERVSHQTDTNGLVEAASLTYRRRFRWIILAFIPSSLMLGVTTYISTDVASMPLIWIIPLSLYLLTFILAFANKQIISLRLTSLFVPAGIICLGAVTILGPPISVWLIIALHLTVFFLVGFICHRQIALDRPPVNKLAEYYLCISIGGVLGGIINALLAPLVFSMPLEYPIVFIAACMTLPVVRGKLWSRSWLRVAFPALMLLLTAALSFAVPRLVTDQKTRDGLILCLPLLVCYLMASRQGIIFGLSILAVMIGGYPYMNDSAEMLTTQRNFFGVWRVASVENGRFHRLQHGSTTHGGQYVDSDRKCNATAYYHKDGPLGQIFNIHAANSSSKQIGVIGLGAGTMITYSADGEQWDFYEIDPTIVRIAQSPAYFSFLSDCSAAPYRMILGDARLRLQEAPNSHYGLLILDAFSSDSVPAHLVTSQAMDLYLSKLAPDGLMFFHISNRYLNLEPLVSGLSQEKGLSALIRDDREFDTSIAKNPSVWVVIARSEAALGDLVNNSQWRRLEGNVLWSDDFSNILSLIKR